MASPASLLSPALTHASSAEDFDSFLDFSSHNSPNAVAIQGNSLFENSEELNQLWQQFYPKSANDWFLPSSMPSNSMSIDPSLTTPLVDEEFPFAAASLPTISSTSLEQYTPESQDVEEDDGDEYMEEQPRKTKSTKALALRKKKPSASAVKRPSTRKTKPVSDLALPMPEEIEEVNDKKTLPTGKDEQGHLPHIVFPVPDYIDRPSAEDYAKLSSKEKRQLRNKISARNFRHRRKEYITTLEEEIATRDTTISSLEEEMSTLRIENKTLRTDLDLLKKTVEDLLNKARPADQPVRSVSPLLKPNLGKDRSPFASSSSSSWSSGGFVNALPTLNVHTTFVPSPASSLFSLPRQAVPRNMNPKMNTVDSKTTSHLPGKNEDDTFIGGNPFLLNPQAVDRYRAQLYGKIAHNVNGSTTKNGVAVQGFKPSFFTALEPSSSKTRTDEVIQQATQETARVASIAQTTLVSGLVNTFWKTFSGGNPHEMVDLLQGKSSLRIVPNTSSKVDSLADHIADLSVSPTK